MKYTAYIDPLKIVNKDDLIGKTISKIVIDEYALIIKFSDNTYCYFSIFNGWDGCPPEINLNTHFEILEEPIKNL